MSASPGSAGTAERSSVIWRDPQRVGCARSGRCLRRNRLGLRADPSGILASQAALLRQSSRFAGLVTERPAKPHQTLRSYAEVARFFDGLELLEPGLVQWHLWRPEPGDAAPDDFKSGH
ncbi:MAG TPA: SAM-dependent methyltransferase, partial [Trebonia sp.]|nr:SAM-dependent methyltransferase [Trebonia sp.]